MGESIVMFKRIELVSEDVKSVTNAQKAQILMNALPYIKKYSNKIVVVKYGGNAMINEDLRKSVMGDIVLLNLIGTIGGKAIGLCGIDDQMIKVQKQSDELGYVGRITDVDVSIIKDNLDKGYIPVISTIGTDTNGQAYNINADTAAAKIAGALNAECMLSMTNIDGVLKDKDDPDSLLTEITLDQARQLENDGIIAGGMIPKVQCCTDAIKAGVKRVFIINGTVPHAILIEMLTEEGLGTMFVGHYSIGK